MVCQRDSRLCGQEEEGGGSTGGAQRAGLLGRWGREGVPEAGREVGYGAEVSPRL